jgi:hypothetical protein
MYLLWCTQEELEESCLAFFSLTPVENDYTHHHHTDSAFSLAISEKNGCTNHRRHHKIHCTERNRFHSCSIQTPEEVFFSFFSNVRRVESIYKIELGRSVQTQDAEAFHHAFEDN